MKTLTPQSEAELAEIVAAADGPLCIEGGGTRPVGRPVAGTPLSVAGVSGIVDYVPGALTLIARAGTPIEEIEAVLAAQGQRLAFEPMDHRPVLGTDGTPTIGGVVAGNVSGPRRVAAGACRDFLLGVRFVDGQGRILKNGGRVMKNVTGYDLVRLMAGSRGTLGVLSEVALKVLPAPEAVATLTVHDVAPGQAIDAMTRAITSPFEVTGAAHVAGPEPRVHLRIEGFEGSVAYRGARLRTLLRGLGEITVETGGAENAAIWRDIRDVAALKDSHALWSVSMTPGAVYAGLLPLLAREGACETMMDWAGGRCWVALPAAVGAEDAAALHRRVQAAVADRDINGGGGGHATLVKGPEALRRVVDVFQPEPAPVAALAAGLRRRFDPKGILNPELMG